MNEVPHRAHDTDASKARRSWHDLSGEQVALVAEEGQNQSCRWRAERTAILYRWRPSLWVVGIAGHSYVGKTFCPPPPPINK